MELHAETIGGYPPQLEYKRIVFVDKSADMAEKDVKALEGIGYTVIQVVGSPHQVLSIVNVP